MPGLIELVTKETTAPGQRHAALAGHEGEIAIRAWAGNPTDPKTQIGGVTWILAVGLGPLPVAELRDARRSRRMHPATARSAGRPPRC